MPRFFIADSGGVERLIKRLIIADSGGTPRQIKRLFIADSGGVARLVFAGVEVDASTISSQTNTGPFAGIRFLTDGTWETMGTPSSSGSDFTPPQATGTWLLSGSASNVWIERVLQSNTFNVSDPGAGRHQLNVTRTFVREHIIPVPGGSATACTFNFYDAPSGGNLLDSIANRSYSSQRTS